MGNAAQLRSQLESTRVPITDTATNILPPGIALMTYEGTPQAAAKIPAYVLANTAASGFVALYRKRVHLGCTVPFCNSSKWFECPCHGSKYSINGEYRAGPAPRSLDRFKVDIVDGRVVVDTATVITGPPRGTVTSQPQPEGPHCVTIAGA
jgi:Rieske Fe-S protein